MDHIGIFDLPLELREMIYAELLPEDGMLASPSTDSETGIALFKADGRLRREYRAVARRKLCGLRIVVLSSRSQAFKFGTLNFEDVRELEICLDYRDRTFDKGSLGTLRSNLIRLVERLAQCNELKAVSIKTCINGLESVYGDLDGDQIRQQWEAQDPWTYTEWRRRLSDILKHHYTIFQDLLPQLLKLPVCREARVGNLLIGLKKDNFYMLQWAEDLEIWFKGQRDAPFPTWLERFQRVEAKINSLQIAL